MLAPPKVIHLSWIIGVKSQIQPPWQEGHKGVLHIPNNQLLTFLHEKMMSHSKGIAVNIIDIEIGDCGHLIKEHEICDSILSNDMVAHF